MRDNHLLCQLSVKPKANVSSQLNFRLFVSCQLKFWPFVSCQLTPSRPSSLSVPETPSWLDSWRNFWDLRPENEGDNLFFFRHCHRWASGATVVVVSEAANINIIFASSQRWDFMILYGYCKRESSSLFFVGLIVVVEEIYTSVSSACWLLFFLHYDS